MDYLRNSRTNRRSHLTRTALVFFAFTVAAWTLGAHTPAAQKPERRFKVHVDYELTPTTLTQAWNNVTAVVTGDVSTSQVVTVAGNGRPPLTFSRFVVTLVDCSKPIRIPVRSARRSTSYDMAMLKGHRTKSTSSKNRSFRYFKATSAARCF